MREKRPKGVWGVAQIVLQRRRKEQEEDAYIWQTGEKDEQWEGATDEWMRLEESKKTFHQSIHCGKKERCRCEHFFHFSIVFQGRSEGVRQKKRKPTHSCVIKTQGTRYWTVFSWFTESRFLVGNKNSGSPKQAAAYRSSWRGSEGGGVTDGGGQLPSTLVGYLATGWY